MFQSYDYGIAQAPELESHGGTTFCAVATLELMNQLNTCFTNKQVKRWPLTGFSDQIVSTL
jgi:geranylgeranyl transferase type-1 subunit beta